EYFYFLVYELFFCVGVIFLLDYMIGVDFMFPDLVIVVIFYYFWLVLIYSIGLNFFKLTVDVD
ncbi:hypothetical protein ACJBWD_10570, partial [Streptococcus suis]